MPRPHFQSVDEYINSFPDEIRLVLQKIRSIMRAEMPDAEEVISYQIPCYKLIGKHVIYFAGFNNHVSLYPIPKGNAAFQKKIAPHVKGKGTISFPLTKQVPYDLVKEIVKIAVDKMSNFI